MAYNEQVNEIKRLRSIIRDQDREINELKGILLDISEAYDRLEIAIIKSKTIQARS